MANTNNSSRFKYSESPCHIENSRLGTIHHIGNLHLKYPSTASKDNLPERTVGIVLAAVFPGTEKESALPFDHPPAQVLTALMT